MKFVPSQTLVTTANRIFLILGIGWFVALLVLGVTYCATNPECSVITESKAMGVFIVINSLMVISWVFMCVITYRDLCAKAEAGTIEAPPQRPTRDEIGHNSSVSEALRVFNEGEKLNGWYLIGYVTAFVLIELVRLAEASIWLLIPAAVCFAVPEIRGIMIRKHTLSQTVWIFQVTGSHFRKIVGTGLALWISLVVYDSPAILAGEPYTTSIMPLALWGYPVAELILIASLILWIVIGTSSTIARAIR